MHLLYQPESVCSDATHGSGSYYICPDSNHPACERRAHSRLSISALRRSMLVMVLVVFIFTSGAVFHSFAFSPSERNSEPDPSALFDAAGAELQAAAVTTDQRIIVQPGDTWWDMALTYAADGEDPRRWIDRMLTYNELSTSTLQPGQVIYILVP